MARRRRPLTGTLTLTLTLASVLVLAACSDDDDGSPVIDGASAPAPGIYAVTLEDGSHLVVTLDVPADDTRVAPFEQYRTLVGAGPVVWLVGEITPPDGADSTGRYVTFLAAGTNPTEDDPRTADDGISTATFACSLLDRWLYADDAEVTDEAVAAYNELFTGPCNGNPFAVPAPARVTTTYVMAYEEATLPAFDRLLAGLAYEMSPTS